MSKAARILFLSLLIAARGLNAQQAEFVSEADSGRFYLCAAAYQFNSIRAHADTNLRKESESRVLNAAAVVMSGVADAILPKALVAVTRARLLEVPRGIVAARDSMVAALQRAYAAMRDASKSVDYRKAPTLGDMDNTEAATIEVSTLMDREYIRARSLVEQLPPGRCLGETLKPPT